MGMSAGVKAPCRYAATMRDELHDGATLSETLAMIHQEVAEVVGTWQVDLRRGCRPGRLVLQEVLPVILQLETLGLHSARRPWPMWFAHDRTLPRRVRSGVRAFERLSDTGSTIVVRADSS